MKNFHVKICGVFLTTTLLFSSLLASVPQKITYQAVIRDQHNRLVSNQQIGMRISIVQWTDNGVAVYIETQSPMTNANGVVTIEIGTGTVVAGNFLTIDWTNGPYYAKTEIDLTGGQSYTMVNTQQLLSVPYALHAKSAESISGHIVETDPLFHAHVASSIDSSDISNWNQKQDVLTAGAGISIFNDTIGTTPGTAVGEMLYWDGMNWVEVTPGHDGAILTLVGGIPTWKWMPPLGPDDVFNSITEQIWFNRNLGASQVATSSTDADSYGDLYQWGRGTDGHEKRTSGTIGALSGSDSPGHGGFITTSSSPYDWRNPQNDNLWQGVGGVNNPCPSGYRLPTEAEWNAERLSWGSNNSAGAFASPLKLPVSGDRSRVSGSLYDVGALGFYWSSTVNGTLVSALNFYSGIAGIGPNNRSVGLSVRCIKD